uniref:Uncharacterized protein n=1 Tax=Pararge aegeria TaxID=116150 RepID=S4PCC1_9NEOP
MRQSAHTGAMASHIFWFSISFHIILRRWHTRHTNKYYIHMYYYVIRRTTGRDSSSISSEKISTPKSAFGHIRIAG